MDQMPGRKDDSIPLPDGGYYASLYVYHNLHCIVSGRRNGRLNAVADASPQKRLQQHMYADHYFPNMTTKERHANEYHNRMDLQLPVLAPC